MVEVVVAVEVVEVEAEVEAEVVEVFHLLEFPNCFVDLEDAEPARIKIESNILWLKSTEAWLELTKRRGTSSPAVRIPDGRNRESPSEHPERHEGHKDEHSRTMNPSQ